jgi:hypothetical protein
MLPWGAAYWTYSQGKAVVERWGPLEPGYAAPPHLYPSLPMG